MKKRIRELAQDVATICFGDNFEDKELWKLLEKTLSDALFDERKAGIIETHNAALKVIISKQWTTKQLNDWVFRQIQAPTHL